LNVTGNANAAFGAYALNENTAASNTACGALAGRRNTSGGANTSVGSAAVTAVTTGSFNTGVGAGAGQTNQTGAYNCSFGYNALYTATGGPNHAFGANALQGLTTGVNNIAIGYSAGRYIADGATLNTTGSQSIFIGDTSKANADGEANQIVIGYLAVGAGANTATLGNTSITTTVLRGNIRIGATEGTSATQTVALANGTAPSTSPADAFQIYSADMAAGNAVPHIRTEDGTVVKLSQSLDVVKPVTAAGATPVDSDVAAWGNNSMGVVVGTGGRVFFTFKNAADVYYVEATAI
jgi:hypothetical protein